MTQSAKRGVSRLVTTALLLVGLLHVSGALGWSVENHGKIGVLLANQLPAQTQQDLIEQGRELARRYPDEFRRWHYIVRPQSRPEDFPRLYVAFLAGWPDLVRDTPVNELLSRDFAHRLLPKSVSSAADTSRWHYTNTFFDRQTFELLPRCDSDNYGQLTQVLEALLKAPQQPMKPEQRAVVNAFIIHLISDLHLPVHNLASVERDRCRDHDRGGNRLCLSEKGGRCQQNLHQYWDRRVLAGEYFDKTKNNDQKYAGCNLISIDYDQARPVEKLIALWHEQQVENRKQAYAVYESGRDDARESLDNALAERWAVKAACRLTKFYTRVKIE